MPKKNQLYQCPYERACKCDLLQCCLGCETWAEHYGKFSEQTTNSIKAEIAALATELQDFNDRRVAAFGRVTEIVAKMRQLSAV